MQLRLAGWLSVKDVRHGFGSHLDGFPSSWYCYFHLRIEHHLLAATPRSKGKTLIDLTCVVLLEVGDTSHMRM